MSNVPPPPGPPPEGPPPGDQTPGWTPPDSTPAAPPPTPPTSPPPPSGPPPGGPPAPGQPPAAPPPGPPSSYPPAYAATPSGSPPSGGWPGLKPDGSTKGPKLSISLVLLGLGFLAGAVALAFIIVEFVDAFDGERFDTPGSYEAELEEGEWLLFANIDGAFFNPADVNIDGPAAVEASRPGLNESRTLGSDEYDAVLEFEVREAGEYTIQVDSFGPGEAMVGKSITSLSGVVPWILLGAVGGVLFLVGGIMTIVSLMNRSKAKKSRARMSGFA